MKGREALFRAILDVMLSCFCTCQELEQESYGSRPLTKHPQPLQGQLSVTHVELQHLLFGFPQSPNIEVFKAPPLCYFRCLGPANHIHGLLER